MCVYSLSLLQCLCFLTITATAQHDHDYPNRHIQERIPACRRSGGGAYCSAGKTQSYVGPLDSSTQLRDALRATAFKKEIIIFADNRLAHASQAISRIRGGAGYSHLLPVMAEPSECHRLVRIFLPFTHEQGPLSCGTYARTDERGNRYPWGFRYLRRNFGMTEWWRKWFTVARSVALGYNVMAIDGDVLVLDDWYWRVKQPPLSSFTMLSQAECTACINGGFSYIQNASSQGPVAWMLFEAMHRAVRWSEDDSALQAMSQRLANETYWITCPDDQSLLSDVLWNAMRGEVRFASMKCMLAGDTEALQKLGFKDANAFLGAQVPAYSGGAGEFGDLEYAVSGELAEVVCEGFREPFDCRRFGPNVTIRTAVLRMPHSGGVWPREHGGYPFNRSVGPYTEAYRKAFQELGVPLPPSPEDPATEALARNTPTELFGFLHIETLKGRCTGCWAEATWFRAGRLGLWHTHLGAPRVQSIGHIHAGLFPGDFQKTIVMQASGHFDWRVAARIGGGPSRMFFANYPDHNSLEHGWQNSVVEVQRVVAYAPGLITSKLDKAEFIHAAEGLAQVAAALGAVAAWPAAPCDAAWVLTPEALAAGGPPPLRGPNSSSRSFIPWYHLRTQFTVLPFGDSLEELQCEWTGFAVAGCLLNRQLPGQGPSYSGRGLLALEFEHLRRRHIHNVTSLREPTPDTTLRLSEGPQPRSANGGVEWAEPQYDQLLRLNTERLLHQPFQRDPIAIFWLDQLVGAVHGMAGVAGRVYDTWRERCRVLRYYDLREDERSDW